MNAIGHVFRFSRAVLRKYRVGLSILALVVLFLLGAYWNRIFVSVGAGHAAIVWHRFGGTDVNTTFGEGLHIFSPLDSVVLYETRARTDTDTTKVLTVDGLQVEVVLTNRYYPMYQGLGNLHKHIGPKYYERIIQPTVLSSIRRVLSNMSSDEVITITAAALMRRLDSTLDNNTELHGYGWSSFNESTTGTTESERVDDVLRGTKKNLNSIFNHSLSLETRIVSINLPEKVTNAIADKMVEKERSASYSFILKREAAEAERREIEANGWRQFQSISGIDPVLWKSIDATEKMSKSPNSKVIIMGTSRKDLPILLNGEGK